MSDDIARDGWVSNDRYAYLADAPSSPDSSPWSLTTTYWNFQLGDVTGARVGGVDSRAVDEWVQFGWDGRLATSGVPQMTQIAYSAAVSRLAGRAAPADVLRESLGSLQTPGGYKFDTTDADPDPAATALAVEVQRAAGMAIPRSIAQSVRAQLRDLADRRSRLTLEELRRSATSTLAAAIIALPRQPGEPDALDLAGEVARALGQESGGVIDAGLVADMYRASRLAGTRLEPAPPALCEAARDAAASEGQAQFAYYVAELRCPGAAATDIGSPSRSGWVEPGQVEGNPLYLDTARIALESDDTTVEQGSKIKNWFELKWADQQDDAFVEYSRLRLGDALGVPFVEGAFRVSDLARVDPATSLLAAMHLDLLTHGHPYGAVDRRQLESYVSRVAALPPSSLSLLDAAALHLGADALAAPKWDDTAATVVRTLRAEDGLHALDQEDGQVSAFSSALASWITDDPVSLVSLVDRGICQEGGCTASTPDSSVFVSSFSATRLLSVALTPDTGRQRLPLFLG